MRVLVLAEAGGLRPILTLYLHGKPVGMSEFRRLANLTIPAAKRALDAMERFGVVRVDLLPARGAAQPVSISLTERGQRVGAHLHEMARMMERHEARSRRNATKRRK